MKRRLRAFAATAALCAVVGVTAAGCTSSPGGGSPNPSDSVDTSTLIDPTSDSALLNLLSQQGVRYFYRSVSALPANYSGHDATLVIGEGDALNPGDFAKLAGAGFSRVIVLGGNDAVLGTFAPQIRVHAFGLGSPEPVDPSCAQTDALAAGGADLKDPTATFVVDANGGAVGCYPVDGFPTFAYADEGPSDVVALGSATFFENDQLASAGNAALALRLFGAHPLLVWLLPDIPGSGLAPDQGGGGGSGGGSGASGPTLTSLMPSWIWWVLLQLLIALLLAAYWRGRRLGAVVTERLPVTVRAAETVEGHARLYRRANAHGRAAELLRKAAASRMAGYVGVPAARAHADPSVLVAPVAARLNVAEDQVAGLLTGAAPQSEAELVQLADHLDRLEQEVRSS